MSHPAPPPRNVNVPNALTVVRLLFVPLLGWMLLAHPHDTDWRIATAAVFVLSILTDLADGAIARRYRLITSFGKLADPIADKALTGMAMIGLSMLGELWWWVTVLILVREWGITILRLAVARYAVISANAGGKAKTFTQAVALALMLLPLTSFWRWPGWLLMAVALALTVVTGVIYLREVARVGRERRA